MELISGKDVLGQMEKSKNQHRKENIEAKGTI